MSALTMKTIQQAQTSVAALEEGVKQLLSVGEAKAIAFARQEKTIEGKVASANELIEKLTSGELAIALSVSGDLGLQDLMDQANSLLAVLTNGVSEEKKALAKIKAAKESDLEYRFWKATKTVAYNAKKNRIDAAITAANNANAENLADLKKFGGWKQFVEGTRTEAIKAAKDSVYEKLAEGTKPTRQQIHEALIGKAVEMLKDRFISEVEVDGTMYAIPTFADVCKDLANLWDAK